MKKTLLLSAVAFMAIFAVNAQTVWNFSNAPFGANAIAGGSAAIDWTKNFVTTDSLLVLGSSSNVVAPANWTGITANGKTIDGTAYTYRLQTGGGGATTSPSMIPTTRYILITVTGASVIKTGMISSSSSATRTLIIVNEDQSVVDSIVNIGGATASTYTYNYNGKAGKVYLYSRASGLNYYYLSATNVVKNKLPFVPSVSTGINQVMSDLGISFNGTEVVNTKGLNIEVYSVLGKKVAASKTSISTSNLQKGIYIVRAAGLNGSLKFSI
jgi:hypothetical protein